MKNALKFLGLIALVAVIGFSFAACGDAEQGPAGAKGEQGDKGDKGDPGTPGSGAGMIPYIPTDSGLLGTLWAGNDSNPDFALAISDDGYTVYSNGGTYQLLSYWKGSDGTVIQLLRSETIIRIGISGNTLTLGDVTFTKILATPWVKEDFYGTWKKTTGSYQPYTLTVSADTIRVEDKDGDFIQYANVQWGINGNFIYPFTGTRTYKYYSEELKVIIGLSEDRQKLFLSDGVAGVYSKEE
jgi:hypothetical protein